MASSDYIPLVLLLGIPAAYILNLGGFRDWAESYMNNGGGTTGGEDGGGEFGEGDKNTTTSTNTNPCTGGNVSWLNTNYAKCSNGAVCWSNVPCGGTKKVAICGKGFTQEGIRNAWLAKYKCKTGTTPKPVVTSCGCPVASCNTTGTKSNCLSCCCSKRCAQLKKSNQTMSPTVTATGSCLCRFKDIPMIGGCSKTLVQRCGNLCATQYGSTRKPFLNNQCSCFCRATSSFATAFTGRITIG